MSSSQHAFVVSTDGVRSVQTPQLALMSVDQHATPGVPVDLVDVSACPLRYIPAWGLDEDGVR